MAKTFECFPPNTVIKSSDLQLGDVVRSEGADRPWDTCIVQKIDHGLVTLWRPYGHMNDFTCLAGENGSQIYCYTGLETYSVSQDDKREGCGWVIYSREKRD